jgi:hypothetical protein
MNGEKVNFVANSLRAAPIADIVQKYKNHKDKEESGRY